MSEKMRGDFSRLKAKAKAKEEIKSQVYDSEQAELDENKLFVGQEFETFKKQVLKKINKNLRTWGDKEKYSEADFEKFAVMIGEWQDFLNPKDHEVFSKNLDVVKEAIAGISGKFIGVQIDQETFVPFKPKNIEKIRLALEKEGLAKFDDEIVEEFLDEDGRNVILKVNGASIMQVEEDNGSDQVTMDVFVGTADTKHIAPNLSRSSNWAEPVPVSDDELFRDFYLHLVKKMIADKKIDKNSPEYHKIPDEVK